MEENNAMNPTTESHSSATPGPAKGEGEPRRDFTLAIEHRAAQQGAWEEHCDALDIKYRIVDCYANDITAQVRDVDGLICPFKHTATTDLLFARHIIAAVESMNKYVFPNIATCWHFDDKIAQKYLLEAVGAPLAPTHVFYEQDEALRWLDGARFPLVRKLRRGAGSYNVGLVHDFEEAKRYCRTMFGQGFSPAPAMFADTHRRFRQMSMGPRQFLSRLKSIPGYIKRTVVGRSDLDMERGYALFQDFFPNNPFDIRITVVGDKAWGFTRDVRPNDFRASGSGTINYDMSRIPIECVRIAFDVAVKICSQSTAFDFVLNEEGAPKIVEISYGYEQKAVYDAPGQWSPDLTWSAGHCWPQRAILSNAAAAIQNQTTQG